MKTKVIVSEGGGMLFYPNLVSIATDRIGSHTTIYARPVATGAIETFGILETDNPNVQLDSITDFLLACRHEEVIDFRPGKRHREMFEEFLSKKEKQGHE